MVDCGEAKMRIGAHVSVAKGYDSALDYALSVGAECLQFFAKSPRQWRGPAIDVGSALRFVESRVTIGFGPVFTHTAYLLNLSSTDEVLRAKTIDALADELARAAILDVDGVVTHIGNDPDGDPAAAARRAGAVIRAAYETGGEATSGVRLLLENTAGAGSSFGCDMRQIGACIDEAGLGPGRIGMCLDTCHAFAYGYDVSSSDAWDRVLAELDDYVGLSNLKLIHANDCLFEAGARRDRHAWIGDGFIGSEGFEAMVNHPLLSEVAAVTEMPGDPPEKDEVNLSRLKALRT